MHAVVPAHEPADSGSTSMHKLMLHKSVTCWSLLTVLALHPAHVLAALRDPGIHSANEHQMAAK